VLGGILGQHVESFTLSQAFFYGRALNNEAADHQCVVLDGKYIDRQDDLYKFQAKGEVRAEQQGDDGNPFTAQGNKHQQSGRGFENILAELGDGPGLQGFNNPLCAATSSYAAVHGIDFDREALKTLLREAIKKAPKRSGRPAANVKRYMSDEYLDNLIDTAIRKFGGDGLGPVVSERDHMSRARRFREVNHPHLQHYRDDFMDFDAGAYRIVDDQDIRADMWTFLDKARASRTSGRGKDAKQEIGPFLPDSKSVNETLAALNAVVHLNPDMNVPCWLNGRDDLPPNELIAFPNGLLDLRDDRFHPVDTNFFTTAALGFDYVASAPEPIEWKKFLNQIFDGDDRDEQIAGLQEMFGYMLTDDTSQEKVFLLLGPKRSGKGTMLAVLRKLLSKNSVIGPSLKSLGTNFGLQSMIAKQLAIIDDLRVGAPKDQDVLIENVLKITGRGLFTIDRKYKAHWTGTLPVKLLLVSNVLPKLGDDSAALASRFISFTTRISFYRRENPRLLEDVLAPELAGIFHWALEGLRRLRERGYFVETNESRDTREQLANLGSPARAFLAECCKMDPKEHVEKDDLYNAWCDYQERNKSHPGSMERFFAALYAAGGGRLKAGRPRDKITHKQINAVLGLSLLEEPTPFNEYGRGR
jgi:putative DNA primase/helicase